MNKPLHETLRRIAEDMFESLAFLLLLPDDEPALSPASAVTARIDFEGPRRGALFLSVSGEMLPELAANMLGRMDQTPTPDEQIDALKELLNVVCGNFLPQFAGAEPLFNVYPARVLSDGGIPADLETFSKEAAATLTLDAGVAQLALFVNAPADGYVHNAA
jgi:CheY-specific phosphatase CheX